MTCRLLKRFDANAVTEALMDVGIVELDIVPDLFTDALLAEAQTLSYEPQPQHHEKSGVRQQNEACYVFSHGSIVPSFAQILARHLNAEWMRARMNPFASPLNFNDYTMMRYMDGALGITPHYDMGNPEKLIFLLPLSGEAILDACTDRSGTANASFMMNPGVALLIRGVGFAGGTQPVLHQLRKVKGLRYSLGLREMKTP